MEAISWILGLPLVGVLVKLGYEVWKHAQERKRRCEDSLDQVYDKLFDLSREYAESAAKLAPHGAMLEEIGTQLPFAEMYQKDHESESERRLKLDAIIDKLQVRERDAELLNLVAELRERLKPMPLRAMSAGMPPKERAREIIRRAREQSTRQKSAEAVLADLKMQLRKRRA